MKNFFLLFISLILSVPLHAAYDYDLLLSSVRTDKNEYKLEENFKSTVVLKNLGNKQISDIRVTLTINEKFFSEETVTVDLAPGGVTRYEKLIVHGLKVPQSVVIDVMVEIVGFVDENPENNTKSKNIKLSGELVPRKVVIEEATGLWCPWCPGGTVAMNYMVEKYPDDFIGIAVHGYDALQINSYISAIESVHGSNHGYPAAWINRTAGCGVNNSAFEGSYKEQKRILTEVVPNVSAVYDAGTDKITATLVVRFMTTATDADYRAVFILLENGLEGYTQLNNLSNEPNMEPFTGAGGSVTFPLDHVAMGIYPSYSGNKGSFPTVIDYDVPYTYTQTFTLPNKSQDVENLEIVGLVLDKNGKIANADKKKLGDLTAIDSPMVDNNATPSRFYDLSGREIEKPSRGIYIERLPGGKSVKKIVR